MNRKNAITFMRVPYNRRTFTVALQPDSGSWPPPTRLHDHTQRHNKIVRTLLKEQFIPSQRPVPDNTQQSQETDILAAGGIRTRNPSKRAAAEPCLLSANRRTYWK